MTIDCSRESFIAASVIGLSKECSINRLSDIRPDGRSTSMSRLG